MPISPTDFDFVRAMVRKESAIALDPGKEYLVESRLTTLARQIGLGTAEQLIEEVRRKPDNGLRYKIVDAMTTNETSFFRDVAPFDAPGSTCFR